MPNLTGFLSTTIVPDGPPKIMRTGAVVERFLGCPARTYRYWIEQSFNTLTFTPQLQGFYIPRFDWVINGYAGPTLIDADWYLPIAIYEADPSLPSGGQLKTEVFPIKTVGNGQSLSLSLHFYSPSPMPFVGTVHMAAQVGVSESDGIHAGGQILLQADAAISSEKLRFEPKYYEDAARCIQQFVDRFREIAPPFDHLSDVIAVMLTLPDPPIPDMGRLLAKMEELARVCAPLHSLGSSEGLNELREFLARRLGAPTLAARILGGAVAS